MGLPLETAWSLQLLQNAALLMLMGVSRLRCSSPNLWELHWLLVAFCAQSKGPDLACKSLYGLWSGYLKDRFLYESAGRKRSKLKPNPMSRCRMEALVVWLCSSLGSGDTVILGRVAFNQGGIPPGPTSGWNMASSHQEEGLLSCCSPFVE